MRVLYDFDKGYTTGKVLRDLQAFVEQKKLDRRNIEIKWIDDSSLLLVVHNDNKAGGNQNQFEEALDSYLKAMCEAPENIGCVKWRTVGDTLTYLHGSYEPPEKRRRTT